MQNIVLMFPGQGSQSVGMAKDIYDEFSEAKNIFEEASETLNFDMKKLCFEDPESKLNLTEYTQPSILTVSTAISSILKNRAGVEPSLVAGHSLGEYSALVSIGALKFTDALKAVRFRGQAMQRAVPVGVGAMAAYLGQSGEQIPALCAEISTPAHIVEVVNFNSPGQLVLSGHKEAVEKACAVIADKKLGRAKTLPVSAPFHSSLMRPAALEMKNFFSKIYLQAFTASIVANIDATPHQVGSYSFDILVRQMDNAVLWTQSLAKINELKPNSLWIEVGPAKVLQGLAKKTIESANCLITQDLVALKQVLESIQNNR